LIDEGENMLFVGVMVEADIPLHLCILVHKPDPKHSQPQQHINAI